jgi:hypothetical protein
MMTIRRGMILVTAALHGCASMPHDSCTPPQQPRRVVELLFGRAIAGGGAVSDGQWRAFIDSEITPRFPDGLTVVDANGQWRAANGIVRERSKLVTIVLPDRADSEAGIADIVGAYKARFRQESVGVIVRQACVSF